MPRGWGNGMEQVILSLGHLINIFTLRKASVSSPGWAQCHSYSHLSVEFTKCNLLTIHILCLCSEVEEGLNEC